MKKKKIKVAVTENSPFVVKKGNEYFGFEIELWEMIAREMKIKFEYTNHSFQELIPLAAERKTDIALGAITIKEEREKIVDFSHPVFDSGLRILLSKNRSKIDFLGTIETFLTQGYKQLVKPLLVLLMIVFVFGNVLWVGEAGLGSLAVTYFPGIFQSIWLSLCTIIGSDGGMYVYEVTTWYGRLILTLGQITSLAILGILIGEITAFVTTRKIRLNIEGPSDLRGKLVATVQGTTSEHILKSFGATVVSVPKVEIAYEKLKRNKVEAVVFDAPVLVYYALNDGADWAEVVGELFDKQEYGIMMQEDSELRKDVNVAILAIRENGLYEALCKKWFGEAES